MQLSIDDVDFAKSNGLIPVVVQDMKSKDVLMLAYANKEALRLTLETGKAWFWSRSRNRLWMKGEESGNVQYVKDVLV
ncbi:MAG: phosphoribosyl-AMP cyclohydrolase, partial [Candidatus Nitrosocaldus sp.]